MPARKVVVFAVALAAVFAAGFLAGPRLLGRVRDPIAAAPAAEPAAAAADVGPRGGILLGSGDLQVEVVVRNTSFFVYLLGPGLALIEPEDAGGTLHVTRAGQTYDLDLFRVADHLQATSWRPETGSFEVAVAATARGQAIAGAATYDTAALAPFQVHAGVPVIDQHGDHNPRHGGVVLMRGDYHFEVVLDRKGHHRVYLSDEFRGWLPPGDYAGSMVVLRDGATDEKLTLAAEDDFLAARGKVVEGDATARITLDLREPEPYSIDLEFPAPPGA